jgi:hypothetical protein
MVFCLIIILYRLLYDYSSEVIIFKTSSALIVITSRANRSKLCVRKKVKISVDVTTSRVMGNCNSITEITEGKIYSNCQNLNV